MKLSEEDKSALRHALIHLEKNKIDTQEFNGWYRGKRSRFVNQHKRAKELLRRLIETT